MSENETPPEGGTEPPAPAAPGAPAGQPNGAGEPQPGNVDTLPEWAREALTKANREAAGYRTKVKDLEPLAKKAKDLEDASKSEAEKTTERLTVAEQRAAAAEAKAMRLEVAASKGLTPKQAARLVGATVDELEADADELLASFKQEEKPVPPRQPQENLRGGGDPTELPEESDPRKIAAQIPRF